jgi:hypothetical protein
MPLIDKLDDTKFSTRDLNKKAPAFLPGLCHLSIADYAPAEP